MRGQSLLRIAPFQANHRNGTKKATPRSRPRKRCVHSHQKMPLKASRLMPRFSRTYCGIFWYLAKASAHCASLRGGIAPMIGSHSVMESPEPVSRVSPPMVTMARMIRAMARSQNPRLCATPACGFQYSLTGARSTLATLRGICGDASRHDAAHQEADRHHPDRCSGWCFMPWWSRRWRCGSCRMPPGM